MKRSRFDQPKIEGVATCSDSGSGDDVKPSRPRKRSRWETVDDTDKTILQALPTKMPANLTPEQQEQYLLQLPILEITERLRRSELGIPKDPAARSPSPEPVYGADGKRMNTREVRARKKLEDERHSLVVKMLQINPSYRPPADYKPQKFVDKVPIPGEDHPQINFVGLLLGPRGNTLKQLMQETGTTIVIRGKGSVKEGKDSRLLPGQDEPLHAYVTSASLESVRMACERITNIIKEGIEVPDSDNELRKKQLRELAVINGTLRDGDALSKLREIMDSQNIVTNRIICMKCGSAGHIAGDCKQEMKAAGDVQDGSDPTGSQPAAPANSAKLDDEYMSLMAELGVELPPEASSQAAVAAASSSSTTHTAATGSALLRPAWPSYPWNGMVGYHGYPGANFVPYYQMPGYAPPPIMNPLAYPWDGSIPPVDPTYRGNPTHADPWSTPLNPAPTTDSFVPAPPTPPPPPPPPPPPQPGDE